MPIDLNGAAAAVDAVEAALSRHRGAAANWEAATEYLPTPPPSAPGSQANELELKTVIPLPPAFVSQAASCSYKSFMGLFPQIGRAWLTADTRLFLWSYGEDTVLRGAPVADDFYAYDGFNQIIVAVALVRPRRNVFIDDIRYLIAVATPVEVTLLGVSFAGDGPSGEISLIPTNISVATDGVIMLSMSSTPDGRLFMAGNDGNLHEFLYFGQPTGWASSLLGVRAAKRPRKVLHRQTSLIRYVIPPALKEVFAPTDELVDMAVDENRNALYTLSASGALSVYDISDSNYVRLVRSVDLATHAKSVLSYSLPAAEREFISIFPVPPHMSNVVHLVVVSSFGERLYFATSASRATSAASSYGNRGLSFVSQSPPASSVDAPPSGSRRPMSMPATSALVGVKRAAPDPPSSGPATSASTAHATRPTMLKVIGYRPTPIRDLGSSSTRPCFHMALWASGSVLLCDLRSNDHDRLVTIFPDPAAGRAAVDHQPDPAVTSGSGGNIFGSGAPGALLPPAGQTRPAESVHELSLGGSVGRPVVMPSDASTPRQSGASISSRSGSQLVRSFALSEVFKNRGGYANVGKEAGSGTPSSMTSSAPLLEPASMFWVLTSTAIRLYARVTPQQRLASILSASSGGSDEYNLEAFFSHHGVVEASALCLALASQDSSMASVAARALYTHGGRSLSRPDRPGGPHGADGYGDQGAASAGLAGTPGRYSLFGMRRQQSAASPGGRPSPAFDLGRPTQRPAAPATFSGVHDGVCLFLAQALRPLWNEYICTSRDPLEYQSMAFTAAMLDHARESICALVSFLDRFDPDAMLPFDEDDGISHRDGRDSGRASGDAMGVRSSHPHNFSGPSHGSDAVFSGHGHNSLSGPMSPTTPMGGALNSGRSGQDRGCGRVAGIRPRKSSEARRAEVGAIHNVKQLALRCSEAVAFLSILCDHQLHRIVPALQPTMREEFVNMQFCDLVARVPGASVSAALVEVLFGSFAAGGADMGPLCKLLQNRCQSYFDDDDMTLQGGIQRLHAAADRLGLQAVGGDSGMNTVAIAFSGVENEGISLADREAAMALAEEAVKSLKPLAGRIYNIESVFSQVVRVGAIPAAIELALAIGDGADRAGDHSRAAEAYDCILRAVEMLIQRCAELRGDAEMPVTPQTRIGSSGGADSDPASAAASRSLRSAERRKDASLRVALTSSSEGFHSKLYMFLMTTKDGERELLARPSPKVDAFLRSEGRQDLMWKYYAQHGRHADAAAVLVSLAEEENENSRLVDRIGYLSRAAHNAKTALASGDPKATALEADIKDYLDVARVQLRVRDELSRSHPHNEETEAAQTELDGKILDLTVLYNDYCVQYKLYESSLDILRCGSYRDDRQVREIWIRIVDGEIERSQVPYLLEQHVVALGRDFYPSDVVFPVRFLVDLLERRSFERQSDPSWESVEAGWVSRAMIAIGVPLGDIVESYRVMIESNPHQLSGVGTTAMQTWSWSDEDSQLHAIRSAERALTLWAERTTSVSGRCDVERRMLIAESEKALRTVALCKSRLRGMSNPAAQALAQRFDWIEAGISIPY